MLEVIVIQDRDEDGQPIVEERELTPEQIADVLGPLDALKAMLCAQVDQTRDLLIDGGFEFEGHVVQSRQTDRENVEALSRDAEKAIAAGALPGDYGWYERAPTGFGFIMADNQIVPIDAHQMVDMREAGVDFKVALTFFARTLKDQINAAADHAAAQALASGASWPV